MPTISRRFRNAASPSYLSSFGVTPSYVVIPETPLVVDMLSLLGVTKFDSDADDDVDATDSKKSRFYSFTWRSEVRDPRARSRGALNIKGACIRISVRMQALIYVSPQTRLYFSYTFCFAPVPTLTFGNFHFESPRIT